MLSGQSVGRSESTSTSGSLSFHLTVIPDTGSESLILELPALLLSKWKSFLTFGDSIHGAGLRVPHSTSVLVSQSAQMRSIQNSNPSLFLPYTSQDTKHCSLPIYENAQPWFNPAQRAFILNRTYYPNSWFRNQTKPSLSLRAHLTALRVSSARYALLSAVSLTVHSRHPISLTLSDNLPSSYSLYQALLLQSWTQQPLHTLQFPFSLVINEYQLQYSCPPSAALPSTPLLRSSPFKRLIHSETALPRSARRSSLWTKFASFHPRQTPPNFLISNDSLVYRMAFL